MNNQKSGAVGEQPATAVRQPIPVRPVDDSGPAWAESLTPWRQDADGTRWRRTLVGMFDGAKVSQEEIRPGVVSPADCSNFRVIERGPDCPSWCNMHFADTYGQEGEPEQWHTHEVEAFPGEVVAIHSITGNITSTSFPAGPTIEVEHYDRLSAAEARELAEAILRAVELVEGGAAR